MKNLYFLIFLFVCSFFCNLIAQETITTYKIPNISDLVNDTKTYYLPVGSKFKIELGEFGDTAQTYSEFSIVKNPNTTFQEIIWKESPLNKNDSISKFKNFVSTRVMAKNTKFVVQIKFKQPKKQGKEDITYTLIVEDEPENINKKIKDRIMGVGAEDIGKSIDVGKFSLKKSFKCGDTEYEVKRATINIYQGIIVDLKVYAITGGKEYIFEPILSFKPKCRLLRLLPKEIKYKMLISLSNYGKFLDDNLKNEEDNTIQVKLRDVLRYESKDGFVPDDNYLEIKPDDKPYETKLNTNLASFVDVKIFSDALGVISGKPNGLIQGEASSKIFLINWGISKSRVFIFNYLDFGVGLAKFDSKFDSTQIDNLSISFKDRMSFWQRSNQNIYFKLNILSLFVGRKSYLDFNAGVDWVQSRVVYQDKSFNAQLGSVTGELLFRTKANDNFGIDISFMYFTQKVIGNGGFKNIDRIDDWKNMGVASAELHYHPMEKSDDAVYLRARYFTTLQDTEIGNFTQLQLGYKLNFNYKKSSKNPPE